MTALTAIGISLLIAGCAFIAIAVWSAVAVGKRADERDAEWMVCQRCGQEPADLPSLYCAGCQTYEEHQR